MKRVLLAWAGIAIAVPACGYQAVYGGATDERYRVALGSCLVPEPAACDEVLAGARERLARENALTRDEAAPRIVVEVLRSDEGAEALAAPATPANEKAPPVSRSLALGLVVRAWVERTANGPHERDTGDLRALDILAASDGALDPRAATLQAEDALRAVGRRLGHRVALRVLGFPVPADETAGVDR